jgi:hypothetical protein
MLVPHCTKPVSVGASAYDFDGRATGANRDAKIHQLSGDASTSREHDYLKDGIP